MGKFPDMWMIKGFSEATAEKGHGFWFVISEFWSILCVSVFQRFIAFETQSSHVFTSLKFFYLLIETQ